MSGIIPKSQGDKPADSENKNGIQALRVSEHFSGPLPHPNILAGYEKIVPGAAERILKNFESQTIHRHKIEKSVVGTSNIKSIAGLIMGFIIVMTAIGVGIFAAINGLAFGGWLSFSGLALLAGAFIGTKIPEWRSKKEDRVEK